MTTHCSRREKPAKPHTDFPLFPHATGRWAKKVRGRFIYFGKVVDDPNGEAALQLWLERKDDLLAGRTPRAPAEGLTVADLCNRFLTSRKILLDNEEISPRTWDDQYKSCERLVTTFGRNRLVVDLASDDFERLRAELAIKLNLTSLKVEIQRIRGVFKFAYDAGLIDRPVRFGPMFKAPSQRALLRQRQANGARMFEPEELRSILAETKQPLKAMILLALNTGFGNSDLATLPKAALDLDGGWVEFPRAKTGVHRRVPLWPETVAAIREALAKRPPHKSPTDAELVFLSSRGRRWVRWTGKTWQDNLSLAFRRLVQRLGLWRSGVGFYTLRHVFETIGGETRDQVAVDAIMGHVTPGTGTAYRERISDARLKAAVEHVRAWLFDSADKGNLLQ